MTIKHLTIYAILLFSPLCAAAQDVSGTIRDTEGNPLPGASVYWADTNIGVATNIEGKFRIHRVKGYQRLVGTFLGYTNDTISVTSPSSACEFKLAQGVLVQSVTVEGGQGNYIKQDGLLKTENISFAGLCKMACCNLAESFENSASVTVGYSDAISGARQIKMLGLAGTYTQILDENRAIMRGLSAPYGLSYTPGMWLNSIQVSKGISSVTAGHEAITGQINLEHRKPTDEERLFLNLYFDSELRPEINLSSALPLKKDKSLSTVILVHGSTDTKSHDMNHDGYRDLPLSRQLDIANRWLWQTKNGMQVRWGAKYVNDSRIGGQTSFRRSTHGSKDQTDWRKQWIEQGIYGSEVRNQEVNAYFKLGAPVGAAVFDEKEQDELRSNVAFIVDFDHFREDAYFGATKDYLGKQNMLNFNGMYAHYFSARSSLNSGISASARWVNEQLDSFDTTTLEKSALTSGRCEAELGAYIEYTYSIKDKLSVVAGLRYDHNFYFKNDMITPRAHLKWNISSTTVLRASAGMGYRPTDVITDNIGILATGRRINFMEGYSHTFNRMEKALTLGASLAQTISTVDYHDLTISFDYFRSNLYRSVIVDQERTADEISVYSSNGRNFTNTYQADLTWSPVKNLDIFATFRYTDSKYTVLDGAGAEHLVSRPLVSKYKTLLNVQYATRARKWIFDVTAQLNGKSRVADQMGDLTQNRYGTWRGRYPMLYAQITRKIRHWDIYLGCENITNEMQADPIMSAQNPYSTAFNSMNVYMPLMGRKFYVGVRFNMF